MYWIDYILIGAALLASVYALRRWLLPREALTDAAATDSKHTTAWQTLIWINGQYDGSSLPAALVDRGHRRCLHREGRRRTASSRLIAPRFLGNGAISAVIQSVQTRRVKNRKYLAAPPTPECQ